MNNARTMPATNTRRRSLVVTIIQIAAAPLLVAVWAFADAGLPWTLYYLREILTDGTFSSMMQERLCEDWRTWVRAGFLFAILAIWLVPWAGMMRSWFHRARAASTTSRDVFEDQELVILAIHVIAFAMTIALVPWLSRAGLPWRAQTVLPAAQEFADAMFADWPKERITERAGWRVGRTETMSDNRFFIHNGTTALCAFTEGIGIGIERNQTGDAIVIDLNSIDMRDQVNGIVLLRAADVRIDEKWLRGKRIRWDQRIQLRRRVFLVQFHQ